MFNQVIVWGDAADLGEHSVKIVGAKVNLSGNVGELYLFAIMLLYIGLRLHNDSLFI